MQACWLQEAQYSVSWNRIGPVTFRFLCRGFWERKLDQPVLPSLSPDTRGYLDCRYLPVPTGSITKEGVTDAGKIKT